MRPNDLPTKDHFRPFVIHLREAMKTLAHAVMYVYEAEVEGDIAEFGTMSGNTAKEIAASMRIAEHFASDEWKAKYPSKTLHLFDSFEGFPDDRRDAGAPHVLSGTWGPGKCKGLNQGELIERVTGETKFPLERLKVHPGWFSQTVKELEGKLAIVHVDCDLYSSTMDCLVPLFLREQISDGGVILFDDFNCNRSSPGHGQRKAWDELKMRFDLSYSDEGSYGLFGRKFIIHGS